MKTALSVLNNEDFNSFMSGESETLVTHMVDREICEKPENNYIQFIPYVVVYAIDPANGRANFFKYVRASNITEERLKDKFSVGIGGHIDTSDEITYSESVELPATDETSGIVASYKMSRSDLIKTAFDNAKREVREELNELADVVIEKFDTDQVQIVAFRSEADEVSKVHLAYMMPVELSMEQFMTLMDSSKVNKEEIADVGVLPINFGHILEDFEVSAGMTAMIDQVRENSDTEEWSLIAVDTICRSICRFFTDSLRYQDFVAMIEIKQQMAQAQAAANETDTEAVEETANGGVPPIDQD